MWGQNTGYASLSKTTEEDSKFAEMFADTRGTVSGSGMSM